MIGKKLKLLRETKELTQLRLADLLNLNRVSYNRYENNEREPDYETLKKIADFFNVSTDYLLGRNPTKKTEISLSPEKERLIKEIQQASDDDLKEMEYILNYLKSKKEKNEDAATIV